MARTENADRKPVEQYDHKDKKRINNPPVGLVTNDTEEADGRKTYAYDPHLDPRLEWSGKKEHTSFEVPTVSLHVHERIDPKTIIEAVKKKSIYGGLDGDQLPLFETVRENPPLREALDFYKHSHNWSNRLIAGDSLLVMNSLLEKEGMAGQVQTVYIDPPYGVKYRSNFQPFVNKRDISLSDKDEDLTQEPEMIRAFRDTWELGIHSYLTYLRDRLLLAKEILHETGSCFVQISDENVHLVRNLMDEVFGADNFCAQISFTKAAGGLRSASRVGSVLDYLVWYAKDKEHVKYRPLYEPKNDAIDAGYTMLELANGTRRSMTLEEKQKREPLPKGSKPFMSVLMTKPGPGSKFEVEYKGRKYDSGRRWWGTTPEGIQSVIKSKRIVSTDKSIRFVSYFDDFPYRAFTNLWDGFGGAADPVYVVQTNAQVVQRCLLMTTDPGDLVFDPTCGSGTTAVVSEQWGRRWITCDTSRVAVTLAKQRLMTAVFDYYELQHPHEGIGSGFRYKSATHTTLKSIANNEPPGEERLYDQPFVDNKRVRVNGPFTVEAVPAPNVRPISDVSADEQEADVAVARKGPTLRHSEWRSEILKTGIRGKGKQFIEFSRIEPLPGTKWLHAEGETKGAGQERVVVSFGPEHAPLEQRQVESAWEEARTLSPKPTMILFASFEFDPEAAKDIDELTKEKTGMTFLKVKMNNDLLTDDLKKQRSSNQSFWLMGQPDVEVRQIKKGGNKGKFEVEVHGFDYYNTKTGSIESGDTSKIAVWMLDTDYDGRSLYPRQVFFPMAGEDEGWARLAKTLEGEIDEELIESYRGTASLPFVAGKNKRIAVKIVDDRGIESLKVVQLS